MPRQRRVQVRPRVEPTTTRVLAHRGDQRRVSVRSSVAGRFERVDVGVLFNLGAVGGDVRVLPAVREAAGGLDAAVTKRGDLRRHSRSHRAIAGVRRGTNAERTERGSRGQGG